MKKKVLQKLSIVLVLAVFGVMALGSGSSSDDTKSITDNSTEATSQENEEESDNDSEASKITIDEQVLVDQDGIKITAIGMEEDSIWGEGVKLLIENNTDNNVGIGCNALIVNNYMITDLFSSSVAAGKKANEVMYMSSSELEAAGISNIAQIETYFHIYDGDSYDTLFDPEVAVIQTSEYENMDVTAVDDGKELYNQDGIRIVGKYVDENSFWGTAVLLYVENTSGKNIGINCDNMSINGFMVTPYFSTTVYNEKMAIDEITIMSSDLEANGIESVDDIELTFHIYDADSYSTIVDSDVISFSTK